MCHSYHCILTSRFNHYDGRCIHSSCKLFIINSIIIIVLYRSWYNREMFWYNHEMVEGVLVNTRDNERTAILINKTINFATIYIFFVFVQFIHV